MASGVSKVTRSMRIIALPLTQRTNAQTHATKNPLLTYYHFQISNSGKRLEGGLVQWVATKANNLWASLGKAEEGSWKLKTYQYGERLMDRMDFEELALKSIDPSLGPTLRRPDFGGHEHRPTEKTMDTPPKVIPLIHPNCLTDISPSSNSGIHPSLLHLQSLLANRTPRHRKGFYTWMIIAPFTAPFMIVPVVPNLPFFFCVWRSWSHYRAYRASQYLDRLLSNGAIVPQSSPELDKVYTEHSPPQSPEPKSPSPTDSADATAIPEQQLLLTRDAVPSILSLLDLPSSAGSDMYRAIEQARTRVAKL